MGIITKHENIERDRVYIVMRISLSKPTMYEKTPVRAFSSLTKAKEYLEEYKRRHLSMLVDDVAYGGVFGDDLGIVQYAYVIHSMEVDAEYDENTMIGHIPAFSKEQ